MLSGHLILIAKGRYRRKQSCHSEVGVLRLAGSDTYRKFMGRIANEMAHGSCAAF